MEAESSQSNNGLFIILAVALIGLICIGLMGLGGILYFTQSNRAQDEVAQLPPTPTPFPPTFTPTSTATPLPTDTPEPTPTGTLVVQTGAEGASAPVDTATTDPLATPTNTRVLGTPSVTPTPIQATTATPLTPTPESVPGSGGVLSAASQRVLGWFGLALLVTLLVYSLVHRFQPSAR